jgi:hypothetical protein
MPESKVYILGAGCSKHCGYPLGPEMKDDLERFGQSLDSATSPRLLKAVRDTVALMGGSVDTIDTLVQQLYGGQLDSEIGVQNVDLWTRSRVRHQCAQTAALAISAAFLAKEKKVTELGFARYRNFLYQLFPGAGSNWSAIQRSNRPHVLTFNYDQAFEIAFLDRFKIAGYSLYGQGVLNSGLNLSGIGFEPNAFSFLKLHGSVGMWTIDFPGDPIYRQQEPNNGSPATIKDSLFFVEPPDGKDSNRSEREPLLFFPSQRQDILAKETGFLFREFAKAVWNRATELISNATEIHAIGYSFSGIDRGPILEMLGQAHSCRRLVIQSPDADEICSRLKSERPELHSQIESAPFTF